MLRLLIYFVVLLSYPTFADKQAGTKSPSLEMLSQHKIWLNLVHYEGDSDAQLSAIHDDEFFLASDGQSNPLSEMRASIAAFNKADKGPDGALLICQFPARALWLNQQGAVNDSVLDFTSCDKYQEWRRNGDIDGISVIYVTGYLGNPASFYGHTLLKFNSAKSSKATELEDSSLNFGAIVPDQENPLVYIVKGLFGGYDAGFSHIQYFFHNHNYGENELRDMWEYELNLEQADVDLLVAHAWEVLGRKYTYYFLKENCAYRMAELFNILEGVDVVPDNLIWTYPQTLINNIAEAEYQGAPLVKSIKLQPSRQSRFYEKYQDLSDAEKDAVSEAVESLKRFEEETLKNLPEDSQKRVLDALLDYYQLVRDRELLAEDEANLSYNKVLSLRFLSAAGSAQFTKAERPEEPHAGRPPSLVALGYFNHQDAGNYLRLRVRGAYYDALDASAGHNAYSQLSMGEFGLASVDGNTFLDYLDIIRIESIGEYSTGLEGDSGHAWTLTFGQERFDPSCLNCEVLRFQGDTGYGINLSDNVVVAGFIGGALQEHYSDEKAYFLRAKLVAQVNFNNDFRWRTSYEFREHFTDSEFNRGYLNSQMRFELDKHWELRLIYNKGMSEELGLSLGYYW